jgi:ligand-binding sensor domain-containing protein/signal transduction histidine kinase
MQYLLDRVIYARILGLLLGLLYGTTLRANGQNWVTSPLLSKLLIQHIAQDSTGFLWVAATEGLYRYDGYTVTPLAALLSKSTQQLLTGPVSQVVVDDQQHLWIGAERGLYCYSLRTGDLVKIPLPLRELEQPSIQALTLDVTHRALWVSYGRGHVGKLACQLPARLTDTFLRTADQVRWLSAAADGSLWAVTATHQVYRWHHRQWRAALLPPASFVVPLPNTSPQLFAGKEAVYEATADGQLREQQRWLPRVATSSSEFVPCFTKEGWQWVVGGWKLKLACVTNRPQPSVQFLPAPAGDVGSLLSILWQDRSGSFWHYVQGQRGCYQQRENNIISRIPAADGLAYSTRGITRLPDGRLLVGTYNGPFVQAADSPSAPLRPLLVRVGLQQHRSKIPPLFFDVLTTRQRQVIYAEENGVFGQLSMATNQLHPLQADSNTHCVNPQTLFEDHRGRLWGGSSNGLFCLDVKQGRVRRYQARNLAFPLHHSAVNAIAEDATGYLWLATNTGLYKLQPTTAAWRRFGLEMTGTQHLPTNELLTVCADSHGQIWVGTRDQGLLQIDPTRGIRRQLTTKDGLPHNTVVTVLAGKAGRLWLGTYAGLVSYVPSDHNSSLWVYSAINGLTNPELNRQSAYFLRANLLYVGGVGGLYRFPLPATLSSPEPAPQLLVSGSKRELHSGVIQTTANRQGKLPSVLRMATEDVALTLYLALTDYSSPTCTRYYYRFVTASGPQAWQRIQDNSLRLYGLPKGNHTLEITGITALNTQAVQSLQLSLVVTQPWWQHSVIWGFEAATLFGIVYLYRQRRLAWQLRLDHEQNQLRNRIAADLHDELGSLLMRIHVQVESAAQAASAGNKLKPGNTLNLQRLLVNTRALSGALRDVVWCMDSHASTLTAVLDRMHDQLDQVEATSSLHTALEINGLNGTEEVPSELRQQFYMIFKEAVTNTLRHAHGATHLRVRVACQAGTLSLEIDDDGNAKLVGRSGLGLRSMRQRADSIKGLLETGPRSEGRGFRVQLRVPFVLSS